MPPDESANLGIGSRKLCGSKKNGEGGNPRYDFWKQYKVK